MSRECATYLQRQKLKAPGQAHKDFDLLLRVPNDLITHFALDVCPKYNIGSICCGATSRQVSLAFTHDVAVSALIQHLPVNAVSAAKSASRTSSSKVIHLRLESSKGAPAKFQANEVTRQCVVTTDLEQLYPQ